MIVPAEIGRMRQLTVEGVSPLSWIVARLFPLISQSESSSISNCTTHGGGSNEVDDDVDEEHITYI
jgi:hypothetical protein